MKVSQCEIEKCHRVGVDEKFIKFRSSPNFKNMKKFIKSKIGKSELSVEKVIKSLAANEEKSCLIQPPLPLDPPPPDSPRLATVSPKKEIIDDPSSPEICTTVIKIENDICDESASIKPPVCRDFLRHNCTRANNCKFRHEFDVSQLYGVYEFCRDYQNSVCRYPNCKYVHATVFEEARFYETGELPPHALSHQKKQSPVNNNNSMYINGIDKNLLLLPPPPPPPLPANASEPQDMPLQVSPKINVKVNLANPPPSMLIGVDGVKLPIINPGSMCETIEKSSNSKRSWSGLEELNATPRSQEVNAKRSNKCENCVLLENRVQLRKLKVENMTKSALEFNEKLAVLEKKHQRLLTCMLSLIKPATNQTISDPQPHLGHLYSLFNFSDNSNNLFPQDDQNKISAVTAEQLKNMVQSAINKLNNEESIKTFPVTSLSSGSSINLNMRNNWNGHA